MKTILKISIVYFILLPTVLYSQEVPKKMNFKARDAAWRANESSTQSDFRTRDRKWIRKDALIAGWRKEDLKWRETDSKSENLWRKNNAAWLKEDSR